MDRSSPRPRRRVPASPKPADTPQPQPQASEPPKPSPDDAALLVPQPSPATLYRRACRYAAAHANAEMQRDGSLMPEEAVFRVLDGEDWDRFGGDEPDLQDVLALMPAPATAAGRDSASARVLEAAAAASTCATLYACNCRRAAALADAAMRNDQSGSLTAGAAARQVAARMAARRECIVDPGDVLPMMRMNPEWRRFIESGAAAGTAPGDAPSCATIAADACVRAAAFADAAMRRDKGGTLTAAEAARQAAARMAARGEAVVRAEDVLEQMSMGARPRRPLPGVAAFTDAMLQRDAARSQAPAEPADTPDAPTAGTSLPDVLPVEELPFRVRVVLAARRARAALGMTARPFAGVAGTLIPLPVRSDSDGLSFLDESVIVSFVDNGSGSYRFRNGIIEDCRKPVFVAMLQEIYGDSCVLPPWLTNSRSIFIDDVDKIGVCAPFGITVETEEGRQVVKASMLRQGNTLYFWLDDPNPLRLDP